MRVRLTKSGASSSHPTVDTLPLPALGILYPAGNEGFRGLIMRFACGMHKPVETCSVWWWAIRLCDVSPGPRTGDSWFLEALTARSDSGRYLSTCWILPKRTHRSRKNRHELHQLCIVFSPLRRALVCPRSATANQKRERFRVLHGVRTEPSC